MLAGGMGSHVQWAMDHQIKLGNFFDTSDIILMSQVHMMADVESLRPAGALFMKAIAKNGSEIVVPVIANPRGIYLSN